MKNFYTSILFFFIVQLSFGQYNFQDKIITDALIDVNEIESIYSADIDNDGDLDIVSASERKISWFENLDGLGNFSEIKIIDDSIDGGLKVLVVDVDGDGFKDLVLASSGAYDFVSWYKNIDGNGTFGPKNIINQLFDFITDVMYGDVDGDNDIDLFVATSSSHKITYYENLDGLGSFGSEQIISTNVVIPESIDVTDIDGDGDLDVISASVNDDKIAWYENLNGQGNFGSQQVISINDAVNDVYAQDVDEDGDIDILNLSNDGFRWIENLDGQGSFGLNRIISLSTKVGEIAVGDTDNDGDDDLIVATNLSAFVSTIVHYEKLTANGVYGNNTVLNSANNKMSSISVEDMDGDGQKDVLYSVLRDEIGWLKNTGSNNFEKQEKIIVTVVNQTTSIFASDLDGDGDLDFITTSLPDDKISWFENINGLGEYGPKQVIANTTLTGAPRAVTAADIDGDDDNDIIVSIDGENNVVWFENIQNTGEFSDSQVIASFNDSRDLLTEDLDNDGDQDLIVSSVEDSKVSWLPNNGDGTFGTEINIDTFLSASIINAISSDVNGDGNMDIIVSYSVGDSVFWYENLGLGMFGARQIISDNLDNVRGIYANDIDNDGDTDIVAASIFENKIVWFENTTGMGDFGSPNTISDTIAAPEDIVVADMDGDTFPDIVVVSTNNQTIGIYKNINGQGVFSGLFEISEDSINENYGANYLVVLDANNDGKLDVISTSLFVNRIALHNNVGSASNQISGLVRYDLSGDGCDETDMPLANLMILADDGTNLYGTFTLQSGYFLMFTDEGSINTQITSQLPNYFQSNPINFQSDFSGYGNTDFVDFCVEPISGINDLNVSIYPSLNEPRPGFLTAYQIVYNNVGTTLLDGTVVFDFDETKLQFENASENVDSQSSDSLTFNFSDLAMFETRTIDLVFSVFPPPTTNIDDILVSSAIINSVTGDETEEDNTFTLEQTVIGSYDPNDITVLEGDEILIDDIDKYLHYLIRFQNTGTANAINVNVEHVLDNKLDFSSMQIESLSHTGRVEIENETDVSFIFNNINLPDSTNDEPNSHGYIAFKIKPKTDVQVGDIISGVADIYFDFNPPITTNTVNTEIVEPLSVDEEELQNVKLYPNPAKNKLQITSNQIIDGLTIVDINGRELNSIEISVSDYSLDVSSLSKGVYFLEIQSGESKSTKKFIKN